MTAPSTSTAARGETATTGNRGPGLRVAILLVLTLTLAIAPACGDDDDSADSSPSPTTPVATRTPRPPATPTPTPVPTPVVFEAERAMTHMRVLAEDIGIRNAGSDNERRAADYIRDELASYGFEAQLQPFAIPQYIDVASDVELTAPESRPLDANGLQPSPDGDVTAEVVSAGYGHAQEIPVGTSGKIVLVERGGDIGVYDKSSNAYVAGAVGILVYNWEPGNFVGQMSQASRIPVMAISREDGLAIIDQMASNTVTARIHLETARHDIESWNVVAQEPGTSCRIVVGGHFDSVSAGPGANDNASGTVTVLEMARVRSAAIPPEDVCYVLFGAEEAGLLGSGHYVSSLTEAELSGIRAMLNFDMLAVGQGWPLLGSDDMIDVAIAEAERLGLNYRLSNELPGNVGSDHANFANAGVPTLFLNCFCDANWHTPADRIEAIDPARIKEAGDLGIAIISTLLSGVPAQ